jgi:hypothetical protein
MSINVYDNFFSEEDYRFIFNYCIKASYFYGDSDAENNDQKYYTGLTHEVYYHTDNLPISEDSFLFGAGSLKTLNQKKMFDLFSTSIEKEFPEYKTSDISRLYINCFAPTENPYFHIDGSIGTTFLYYPNPNYNLDEGGETQFIFDNNIFGVPPSPNRLISFDANILHKATTFRDRHRFTIAIKYGTHRSSEWSECEKCFV